MFGNVSGNKSNIYEWYWSKFDQENFILDCFSFDWEDLFGNAKVWKVSLENTTSWKTIPLTSSLDLCAPAKLTQITVLEASKMKQKSSMTDQVHQNDLTVKNVKRYQPVKNACAVTKFRQLRHFI